MKRQRHPQYQCFVSNECIHSRGNYHYETYDYKRALTLYSRAAIFFPKECVSKCLTNRSACLMMLGDYKSSLLDSRKAIEYDENYERAYERVIAASLHLGELEAVDVAIDQLKSINPNNVIIQRAVNKCDSIITMRSEAEMYSRLKNFEKAIEKIEIAIKHSTACEKSLLLRETYLNARKNQSESAARPYILARRFYNEGKLENCIAHCTEINVIDPYHKEANNLMSLAKQFKEQKEVGNTLFFKQNYLKAYQLYREALKIDPSNVMMQSILHHNLAATNFNLLDYKQAIKDATAALKHNPKYTKALVIRAKCYFIQESYNESREDCKSVLIAESNEEIETLLKKNRLEENNQNFIKETSVRANTSFTKSKFKDCISNCKQILEIKEIFEIRKLLEKAKLEESNRILIKTKTSKAEDYYKMGQYDFCWCECNQILKIETRSDVHILLIKASGQIRNNKSISEDLLRANDLFNKKLFKESKKCCNEVLFTINIIEDKLRRDQYKYEANSLLEKISKYVAEIMFQAKSNFTLKNFNQCITNCERILNIEESEEARKFLKQAISEKIVKTDLEDRLSRARKYFERKSFKDCMKECNQILKIREMEEARQILKHIRKLIDEKMEQAKRNFNLEYFDQCIKNCEFILSIEESLEASNIVRSAKLEKDMYQRICRARKYFQDEKFKECLYECDQILEIKELSEARKFKNKIKDFIDDNMTKAKRNFNLEYFDQCIKNCEFILSIEDSVEVETLLDTARTEHVSKVMITEGLNRARRSYNAKHYRDCIKECRQLLRIKEINEANNLIEICEVAIEAAQFQLTGKLMESARKFYGMKNYKRCLDDCYKILKMVELSEARELVKKIKIEKENRKYINDLMIRARKHYQSQSYKECISECEIILGIEELEEAEALMKKAKVEMNRKYINDIMSRARQNFKFENYEECIDECLKVLEIEDLMEAKSLMKNAKLKMQEKKINEIMEKAKINFEKNNFKECIEDCEKALEVDRNFNKAKTLMEAAQFELKNARENFVKNKLIQAKLQFDKAEYEKCVENCTAILEKQEVADVKDMLKKSKTALAYEKLTNHYEILEVPKCSDQIAIKSSYYLLSMRYHPDKHSKSTKEMRIYCENLYKKITNAYRVLSKK